ncbi:MAG: T9SS type A sorting domain-containing protein [Thermoplasmata archaeon]|nr:MAG: T9SS type A sorting domain-containing protein [Thermoplasmata archaeon]
MSVKPVPGGFDPSKTNVVYRSINDAGVAVGVVADDNTSNAIRGLQIIPGTGYEARDINNSGKIVGYSHWYPSNAVIWTNDIPYVYNETPSYAYALNDSGLVVGSVGGSAVIFRDNSYVDLNTLIPKNSKIALVKAIDINNKGEILAQGQRSSIVDFYLLRPQSIITYPGLNDLMVAGQPDTIRWIGGNEGQLIKLEYTVDEGTTYRPINTNPIDAGESKYGWEVPDSLLYRQVTIKMTEYDTGDSLAVSEVFRIKPYVITRVGDDGKYEVYDFDTHRWGFGNNDYEVWPQSWWSSFDYQNGTDPFTNLPYSLSQSFTFVTALSGEFPDWESFVNTFTVDACYWDITSGSYNLTALARWEGIKRNWGGSCFGIANANALAFYDKDSFRTKYPGFPNFAQPIEVHAAPAVPEVIPVVSELFTYQYGQPYKAHDIERRSNSYPTETVEQLKSIFSEDDVSIKALAIYNNNGNGGHEILPYRLEQDREEEQYYYIYVWDNSDPNNENAMIVVDTSVNGNRGFWNSAYAWNNWGGEKYLYLDLQASQFLSNPTLAKRAFSQKVFAVPSGTIEIDTPNNSSVIITNTLGNQMGSDGSILWKDIPDGYPLYVEDGSESPPYGYQLPNDTYAVELSNFGEETTKAFFFMENGTYAYRRFDASQDHTDRILFDSGLSVTNPDDANKSINLEYIINEPEQEKQYMIKSLILSPDDSIRVEPVSGDQLILKSFGDATTYDIMVGTVSETGLEMFEHVSVSLSENTTHTLVPDWTNGNAALKILIDSGNDGSVDDSLSVENQPTGVEERGSQIIPDEFKLNQNYPNPFNPTTTISYNIPERSRVTIAIYTIAGQQIRTYDLGVQDIGNHEFLFDGTGLPSGVYLYRVENGLAVKIGRMLLMK